MEETCRVLDLIHNWQVGHIRRDVKQVICVILMKEISICICDIVLLEQHIE